MGDREVIWPFFRKKPVPFIPKCYFLNGWKKKIKGCFLIFVFFGPTQVYLEDDC